MIIGFAVFFVIQNPYQFMSFIDNIDENKFLTILDFIVPAIIVLFFIFSIRKNAGSLNLGSKKQKIASPGLAEKYLCKNCGFVGPYDSYKTQNQFFIRCPKCNKFNKIYAIMDDGKEQKVAPLTGAAIIAIIIIISALIFYLD